jgi:ParB family transcriptional regulator, chromosome partitioning protein
MSDRTKIAAASKDIVFVPLNKLKKSPKNVRQVPHTKADIQAFAASIAAIGMLQYRWWSRRSDPRASPQAFIWSMPERADAWRSCFV